MCVVCFLSSPASAHIDIFTVGLNKIIYYSTEIHLQAITSTLHKHSEKELLVK